MDANTFILFDVDNLSHRNFHAMKGDAYHLRVVLGLLRDISNTADILNSKNFAFCFDLGESIRTKIYPDYKADRVETDDRKAIRLQTTKLREEILPKVGFKNLFALDTYEADDLIGFLCQNKKPNQTFAIVSNDTDFFQLLREKVYIWNPHIKRVMTHQRFQREYDMTPDGWLTYKSLCGCATDNIVGICGKTGAMKYVQGRLPKESKKYKDINSLVNCEMVERNRGLIQLPCPHLKDPKLTLQKDKITHEQWRHVMNGYDFNHLLSRSPFQ